MLAFLKKKQFWGALVGVALLLYCVKDLSLAELKILAERVDLLYLIPALICSYIFVIFKGVRFQLILSQRKSIPFLRAITLYSAGQVVNLVMPVLTGQVGRMILFSKREHLRRTFIFSSILLETVFDALSLIVFMGVTSLAFVFPHQYSFMSWIVGAVTVVVLALMYLTLHYQRNLEDTSARWFRSRWPSLYVGLRKFIRSFTTGIELLRSSQNMAAGMGLSILVWILHMMVVWFLMMSFGFTLPLGAAAVVMIINTIVLMVPITPGNAGTFEIAVSTSLAAFAVGRSDAVLFALALHLTDLLPVTTMGFYYLRIEKLSLKEIKQKPDKETILDHLTENGEFIDEEEEKRPV